MKQTNKQPKKKKKKPKNKAAILCVWHSTYKDDDSSK